MEAQQSDGGGWLIGGVFALAGAFGFNWYVNGSGRDVLSGNVPTDAQPQRTSGAIYADDGAVVHVHTIPPEELPAPAGATVDQDARLAKWHAAEEFEAERRHAQEVLARAQQETESERERARVALARAGGEATLDAERRRLQALLALATKGARRPAFPSTSNAAMLPSGPLRFALGAKR